jgi:hypothetical protein
MTCRNENPFDRFPPGFAAHRYRTTPEERERNTRWNQIQDEIDERDRQKLIEEGKLRPDPELDGKPV